MDIVVTAGGSGIGRCLVTSFAELGHRVFTCDSNAESLSDYDGQNIVALECDVSDASAVEGFFRSVREKTPSLDALVNNAGISGPTALMEDIPVEDWEKTVQVNINGMFYITRAAVPLLKANKSGSIINIASNAAFFGFPFRSPYVASKWAVIGLTKTMAMELGVHCIRVNAVCPGNVEGDRMERVMARDAQMRGMTVEAVRKEYAEQSSLKHFVTAGEVFDLCNFLVSSSARNISGQALGVDGHTEGLSLQMGNQ